MIARNASARWNGILEHGAGTVRSHTLNHPYSFATRFGEEEGTSPEELIGSARRIRQLGDGARADAWSVR